MFIRPCYRKKNGKMHAYWALVESQLQNLWPSQRPPSLPTNDPAGTSTVLLLPKWQPVVADRHFITPQDAYILLSQESRACCKILW